MALPTGKITFFRWKPQFTHPILALFTLVKTVSTRTQEQPPLPDRSGVSTKYFRIIADVEVDGQDLGMMLIAENLARPYSGGTRGKWEVHSKKAL